MANTIKDYVASSVTASSVFTTPSYLTGRGATDIQVAVDGAVKTLATDYVFTGTDSAAITFVAGKLPTDGQKIRITRSSSQNTRLTDYTDGALLTADALDADANQLFYVAQEAIDVASETNLAAGTFYFSQGTAPSTPVAGTLWYDTTTSPNVLKVYNGTGWELTAPTRATATFGQSDFTTYSGSTLHQKTNTGYNDTTLVFLNGVKLVKAASAGDIPANGDYFYEASTDRLWLQALSTNDVLTLETYGGSFSSAVSTSEANAAASATAASNSASTASGWASTAGTKATQAAASATSASGSASSAQSFATSASSSASSASGAAYAANTSNTNATAAASIATTKATEAANSATAAATAATNATNTVNTVSADVATVAGISSEVSTVANATYKAKVEAVAGDATDIGTVATNITNVNAVAGVSSDVATVANSTYKTKVETVADDLNGSNTIGAAVTSASNAASSAALSATNANNAAGSAGTASTRANQAAASATAAATSASTATIQASTATAQASSASGSASTASSEKDAAIAANNAAVTAKNEAVTAKNEAVTAKDLAVTSKNDAATSASSAASSATTATTIANDLGNLDNAITNAAGSATSAATSASTALGYRNEAETHKNNAYTYSQSAASAVTYQDLTAIAESKSVTARDVFVYDTSKDSDGGAWRHRTQGTSWYNEALNTSTRGATKKFPAVAVIVLRNDGMDIYDGDDPAMPMWMVFNHGTSNYIYSNNNTLTSVSALDGMLVLGTFRFHAINFVSDSGWKSEDNWYYYSIKPISARNETNTTGYNNTGPRIVNNYVNDVAMTVLPNAPIDADTGLPVPTIAVATDGGVSVIKDDGSVVDLTTSQSGYTTSGLVVFDKDNRIFFSFDFDSIRNRRIWGYNTIPDTDTVVATTVNFKQNADYYFGDYNPDYARDFAYFVSGTRNYAHIASKAVGTDRGLVPYSLNNQTPANSIHSEITSDYNTGWMNGDIKLATLSDTDDTNVTGSELVTNGTFDSNISGWTVPSGSLSTIAHNSGAMDCVRNNESVAITTLSSSLVAGKTYTLSWDLTAISHTAGFVYFIIGTSPSVYTAAGTHTPAGKYTYTFVAPANATGLQIKAGGISPLSFTLDNVSLRLAEEDRSVNGKGLQVHGTVTKTAVATGAELVGYSGFSTSNYLEQPYNSDLDFGTGDFCYQWWMKTTDKDGYPYILSRCNSSGNNGIRSYIMPNGTLRFVLGDYAATTVDVATGTWVHICVRRTSGNLQIFINGKHNTSSAVSQTVSTSNVLRVGLAFDGGNPLDGSLALFRISATAPTAEQIAKIYRDEKPLFQENAKATLYGSSNVVTALAYDDDTELLHAGTSAGRSVFKGLQRVSNTTDAVGVAISASNDLVVEE